MINKEIYFYWGSQSMSFLRFMTIRSFEFFNPDWKIKLITNETPAANTWVSQEEQDNMRYKGYDFRKKLSEISNLEIINLESIFPIKTTGMSNIHIKDILNWFLLSTKSCAVSDMDIMFCKPINDNKGIDWNAHVNICNFDWYRNYMPVSFMLSDITEDGKNIFYEQVYKNSIERYNPRIYESCGANCIGFGNIYIIMNRYKELKINKMDYMTVFPFVNPDPSAVSDYTWNGDNTSLFSENTIGVHWYGGQSRSQLYNGLITIDNFHTFDNTITSIIKKITQ